MSFIKSLMLAIFATIFLTYVLGSSLIELLGVEIYMKEQLIESISVLSASAFITVLLILAALAIVLSVFGSIIFMGLLGVGAIIMFMVGVFWPVLFVALAIWLLMRDKIQKEEYT